MAYDQYVEVLGQVKLPGKYYFKQGTYLSKILELSGGFEDTTFSKSVFFDKGEIKLLEESPQKGLKMLFLLTKKSLKKKVISRCKILIKLSHANVNYFG